jgi:hypothetical protein
LILHPAVLALLAGSVLSAGLVLVAASHAVDVLRGWDLASGSAGQLALERRTSLASTVVAAALALEVAALFLFARTADALAPLFSGAMCAAGTLAANGWGYRALGARLLAALLAGVWLVVNHADGLGEDYPLIRPKSWLLLGLAPVQLVAAGLQARFFLELDPEVITSCCGSLFSRGGAGPGGLLAGLSPTQGALVLFAPAAAAAAAALALRRRSSRGRGLSLALAAGAAALGGAAGIVAFVSPYVYELPSHRCPFCLLQAEYRWVGYPLYAALLVGAVAGIGAGSLAMAAPRRSLAERLPGFLGRLALTSAGAWAFLAIACAALVLTSRLRV